MNLKLTQPNSYLDFRKKMAKLAFERYSRYDQDPSGPGPFTAGFLGLFADETPTQMVGFLSEAQVDGLFTVNEEQDAYTFKGLQQLAEEHARRRSKIPAFFFALMLATGLPLGITTGWLGIREWVRYDAAQAELQRQAHTEECINLDKEWENATPFLKKQVERMLADRGCEKIQQ